ncbi:MAG: response regulator transcription factor [Chloroflexaceae bacterium]|nr:response regulator transcription factor [Chloroflexaceae bacterium]
MITLIAEGKTNTQIALALGVALPTVLASIERICAKLGVDNGTAAAVRYVAGAGMR